MMIEHTSLAPALLPLVLALAACSGTVASESSGDPTTSSSSTGTSATGGTGASTGTSGTGTGMGGFSSTSGTGTGMGGGFSGTSGTGTGMGGFTSTSGTGTGMGGFTSTSGTGMGGGGCVGYVDVVVGNDALTHLTADCANTWNPDGDTTPVGFLRYGVDPSETTLELSGCVSGAAQAEGIQVASCRKRTAPGVFAGSSVTYTDQLGAAWSNAGSFTVDVSQVGGVGGVIQGTFQADITRPPSDIAEPIMVTFGVCRVNDEDLALTRLARARWPGWPRKRSARGPRGRPPPPACAGRGAS